MWPCAALAQIKEGDIRVSSFGESLVTTHKSYIQASAVYNLIPANFREFSTGSGVTSAEDQLFKVSTGTTAGGYAAIQSFRSLNYRMGEGAVARFSAIFNSGVADSWQGVGLISVGDEISFGFNGTEFGVWHRYRGLPEVRNLAVTTPAAGAETLTLTLNGVAYNIPVTAGTVQKNAWEVASWLNTNQSLWQADQLDDDVIVTALNDGPKTGSYSVSSSGSAAGTVTQTTAGVTKTSDFIPRTAWNKDRATWLDPTKGNIYQVVYQYLGFGDISFFVENPETGLFDLVHTVPYANSATSPNLRNPSLRTGLYAVSLGSTTDIVVKSGGFGAFTQGDQEPTRNSRSATNTATIGSAAFTNILTLRNRKTYNGVFNQVEVQPIRVTVANEGTKNITVKAIATSSDAFEHDFQTAGTDLISDVSTSATTGISGRELDSIVVSPGQSGKIEFADIRLPPTLKLSIVAKQNSGGSAASVSAALVWREDL